MENEILESINIFSISPLSVGLRMAILVTRLGKELLIVTSNVSYSMLQDTYQLVYNQIPANETYIQYIVNVTYLTSLLNLQQATNFAIQIYTMLEYIVYFIAFIIGLIDIIINKKLKKLIRF